MHPHLNTGLKRNVFSENTGTTAGNGVKTASVKHYHLLRPATLRGQPAKFNALLQNEKNKDSVQRVSELNSKTF